MTDEPGIVFGSDGTAEDGLCVVAMTRDPDGVWRVEHAFAPTGVTEEEVRDFVDRHLAYGPAPGPLAAAPAQPPGQTTLQQDVAAWMDAYAAGDHKPFELTEWQRDRLREAYADGAVFDGTWFVQPRGLR